MQNVWANRVPASTHGTPVKAVGATGSSGLGALCGQFFSRFLFWKPRQVAALNVSEAPLASLKNWFRDMDLQFGDAYLLEDQVWAYVADLPPEIRRALFTDGDRSLTFIELEQRVRSLEARHGVESFPSSLVRAYRKIEDLGGKIPTADLVEREIQKLQSGSVEQITKLREEALLRGHVSNAERRLLTRTTPEYEIRFDPATMKVRVPDGAEFPVEKKLEDGTLLVRIPNQRVLRTQDYLNWEIVEKYKGDKSLGKNGFWGDMTADGRFMIMDQHHRITAYAETHNDTVLVRIPSYSNNRYYAKTHLEVLRFYTMWSRLSAEEKEKIFKATEKSPIEAIRGTYYRLTGFKPSP